MLTLPDKTSYNLIKFVKYVYRQTPAVKEMSKKEITKTAQGMLEHFMACSIPCRKVSSRVGVEYPSTGEHYAYCRISTSGSGLSTNVEIMGTNISQVLNQCAKNGFAALKSYGYISPKTKWVTTYIFRFTFTQQARDLTL